MDKKKKHKPKTQTNKNASSETLGEFDGPPSFQATAFMSHSVTYFYASILLRFTDNGRWTLGDDLLNKSAVALHTRSGAT